MAPHNKRNRARVAEQKERRAAAHHRPAHYARRCRSGGGGGGGSRSSSYLSARTHRHAHHHHHLPRVLDHGHAAASSSSSALLQTHTYDSADPLDQQIFDYIIVVDVEATCAVNNDAFAHEIIELPAVLIDVRRGFIDRARSFRTYVKPRRHPTLTPFCTQLTGITQADVDAAPTIDEALQMLMTWYVDTIPRGAVAAFAADGPWDFKKFVYDCHVLRDGVACPTLMYEYLDIRTTFATVFNHGVPLKLDAMLHALGMRFDGRPHCGFDDAYNIARIALAMMRAGCVFDFLVTLPLHSDTPHYTVPGYPIYRRHEGSGHLDRDVVHDIAKRCFGADFFAFGEAHRRATLAYRAARATASSADDVGIFGSASGATSACAAAQMRRRVRRDRDAQRQRAQRRRQLLLLLLACVMAVLAAAVVLVAFPTLLVSWRRQHRLSP